MLVKYGNGKIISVVQEEELEEDQKELVAKQAKQLATPKSAKTEVKVEKNN